MPFYVFTGVSSGGQQPRREQQYGKPLPPRCEHSATCLRTSICLLESRLSPSAPPGAGAAAPLLHQADHAVPVDLPPHVHPPKHKQQVQDSVPSVSLLPLSLEGAGFVTLFLGDSSRVPALADPPGNDAHGVVQPPGGQRGVKPQQRPLLRPCSAKRQLLS